MLNKILSVIVPVYGTERYITKCLDSALLATNGLDAEIIIVNDGTKDAAGKIAQKYALEYSRKIRYFEKKWWSSRHKKLRSESSRRHICDIS